MIGTVAVIGVGIMGGAMAGHLLDAGYGVRVYDAAPNRSAPLAARGAFAAGCAREAAADADAVLLALPDKGAVREALLGAEGATAAAGPDRIFANCSTVYPTVNAELGERLTALGFRFLDAPAAGSGAQAEAGTLRFIASGDEGAFAEMLPVFRCIGTDADFAGPAAGAASYAKVCSNAMMAMSMTAFAEAVAMAAKAGVDPRAFVAFSAGGGARNGMADTKIDKILARDFAPTFRTALMLKDVSLAVRLANELGVPTPSLALTRELYCIACREGHGEEDHCALVKCYERWADVIVQERCGSDRKERD